MNEMLHRAAAHGEQPRASRYSPCESQPASCFPGVRTVSCSTMRRFLRGIWAATFVLLTAISLLVIVGTSWLWHQSMQQMDEWFYVGDPGTLEDYTGIWTYLAQTHPGR